jgi:hypothetical protein
MDGGVLCLIYSGGLLLAPAALTLVNGVAAARDKATTGRRYSVQVHRNPG